MCCLWVTSFLFNKKHVYWHYDYLYGLYRVIGQNLGVFKKQNLSCILFLYENKRNANYKAKDKKLLGSNNYDLGNL